MACEHALGWCRASLAAGRSGSGLLWDLLCSCLSSYLYLISCVVKTFLLLVLLLFKISLFLFQRKICRERRSSVHWFTPQMAIIARAELIRSQELLPISHMGAEADDLAAVCCFPRAQRAGLEVQQPVRKPVPIWHTDTTMWRISLLNHHIYPKTFFKT